MGLTSFLVTAQSSMLSAGLVNPFKVIGYLFIRSFMRDYLTTQKTLWTLLVTPVPAAAIMLLIFMFFYYGRIEASPQHQTTSPLSVASSQTETPERKLGSSSSNEISARLVHDSDMADRSKL